MQTFRSYANVMRGRARGNQERILVLAHQTEAMARQKVLKPLASYLEPKKPLKKGASAVLELMRAAKARQDKRGISRGS